MVDFPSLTTHEIGHGFALGHSNEDEYENKNGVAFWSPYRMPPRRLASLDEDKDKDGDEDGKEQSIMKVELLRGTLRRHISDFDLGNIYCGYYENP